jgi:hypothetical protein
MAMVEERLRPVSGSKWGVVCGSPTAFLATNALISGAAATLAPASGG